MTKQTPDDPALSPCRYLVVHRLASSQKLLDYVESLHSTLMTAAANDELYRLSSR